MLARVRAAISAAASGMAAVVPVMMRDCAGLAGAAAIAYGAWMIYPPAGYIAGGFLVLAGAVLTARR